MIYLFAGILTAALAYLLYSRRLVQAGFSLFFVLMAQAGLYVVAEAPFVAAAQIIVYVGGVLILLLFGVMFTAREGALGEPATGLLQQMPGALLALGLLALLLWVFPSGVLPTPAEADLLNGNTERLGIALITDYLLPFEVLSVLLLAALVGAAYISRR